MQAQEELEKFKAYTAQLQAVRGVHMDEEITESGVRRTFTTKHANSRIVTLTHWLSGGDWIDIEIDGVDCGWWNTVEDPDLDLYVDAAISALLGDVQFNRSPIFRRKEGCFKLPDGTWLCVPVRNVFTSFSIRKRLNHPL